MIAPPHIVREWSAIPEVIEYRKASRQMARDILKTDPNKGREVLRMIRAAEQRALAAYVEARLKTHEPPNALIV